MSGTAACWSNQRSTAANRATAFTRSLALDVREFYPGRWLEIHSLRTWAVGGWLCVAVAAWKKRALEAVSC